MISAESEPGNEVPQPPGDRRVNVSSCRRCLLYSLEIALLVSLFFSFSPGVPGVNEPHYLCKAKHFWNASFCEGDVFLESADAHYLFYFSLGLLTKFFSLEMSAWLGRLICWTAIAIGWQHLIRVLVGARFWSPLAAGVMLLLLHYCHFAGEWLIGGVEAKGVAYAFAFGGLGFLIQKRWSLVWLFFGASAAFHVLVGGWAVIAAAFVWLTQRGWKTNLRQQLVLGSVGLTLSLIGLVPALVLTVGQDPDIVRRANEIYTFERIAHHLVFTHIAGTTPARLDFFLFAVFTWIGLQWVNWDRSSYRVLGLFVLATVLIACCAIAIEFYATNKQQPAIAARLLRYYWFRLSDVFVPVGASVGITIAIRRTMITNYEWGAVLSTVVGVMLAWHVGYHQLESAFHKRSQADSLTLPSYPNAPAEFNRKIIQDWKQVCSWIRENTPPDCRFITPRAQSTFKWYAHRSEVVAWKDVPQDAVGIVNWRNRFSEVFGGATFRFGLATLNAERELIQIGKKHNAQYVVIERRHVRERKNELEYRYRYQQYLLGNKSDATPFDKPLCLKMVYPNATCSPEVRAESTYLVYELTIPKSYDSQLKALDEMLGWYRQLEQMYSESPSY